MHKSPNKIHLRVNFHMKVLSNTGCSHLSNYMGCKLKNVSEVLMDILSCKSVYPRKIF